MLLKGTTARRITNLLTTSRDTFILPAHRAQPLAIASCVVEGLQLNASLANTPVLAWKKHSVCFATPTNNTLLRIPRISEWDHANVLFGQMPIVLSVGTGSGTLLVRPEERITRAMALSEQ